MQRFGNLHEEKQLFKTYLKRNFGGAEWATKFMITIGRALSGVVGDDSGAAIFRLFLPDSSNSAKCIEPLFRPVLVVPKEEAKLERREREEG